MIGTGDASGSPVESWGNLNVSSHDSTDACIRKALQRSRKIHFLPGDYDPPVAAVTVGDEVEITGSPGARLKPRTDAGSPVGLFDVTGTGARLSGFEMFCDTTPVAAQAWVRILADAVELEGLRFRCDAEGVTANPTVFVRVGDEVTAYEGPTVRACRFYPHKGVTVWRSALTRDFSFDSACYVGPRKQADGTRYAWRVFDLLDDEQFNIVGATFRALGSAGDPLDYFLRSRSSSNNNEGAHFGFYGNKLETIQAAYVLDLWAARYSQIIGNRFGRCNLNGSNVIRVTGVNGDADPATSGNAQSLDVVIAENGFHNTAKAIELGFASIVGVRNNQFTIVNLNMIGCNAVGTGAYANTASASRVSIKGNRFVAENAVSVNRAITNLTGAGKITAGLWIEGNETALSPLGTGSFSALVAGAPSAVAGSSGRIKNNYKNTSTVAGTPDFWTESDW